jgi:hypothetical protein
MRAARSDVGEPAAGKVPGGADRGTPVPSRVVGFVGRDVVTPEIFLERREGFQPPPRLSVLMSAARTEANRREMLEGRGWSGTADGIHFF